MHERTSSSTTSRISCQPTPHTLEDAKARAVEPPDANPPPQHDLPMFPRDNPLRQHEESETCEAHRVATGWFQATQVPKYSHQRILFVGSWASEGVVP